MENNNSIIKGKQADLLLYGEVVSSGCGDHGDYIVDKDVVREIMSLEETCDKIRIHINSIGGDVYAGIAIFNAIRASKADIEIYTDGLSASIAGIIAMCGRKHYMSKYSRLMIHSVSAGVFGDKKELSNTIEEIVALEQTISGIIAERLHCTPEEVREKYFDGTDHWYTASEAVAMGLADGIYDLPGFQAEEGFDENNPSAILKATFSNRANLCSQIINDMNIDLLKTKPHFTNVVNEEDVLRVIDELNSQIEARESEIDRLKARVEELEAQDIEAIIAAAIKEEKIDAGEADSYRNLFKSNPEETKRVIANLVPKRSVRTDLAKGNAYESGSAWDKRMAELREARKNKRRRK